MFSNVGWALPTKAPKARRSIAQNETVGEEIAQSSRHTPCAAAGGSTVKTRPSARRGVILLVVMVVLALFTLLGLTLVLVTAQGRLSAMAAARANPEATRAGAAMGEALNQIVRGTRDPDSVLQAHSLLEDLYGFPVLFGRVTVIAPMAPGASTVPPLSGQLLTMTIIPTANYQLAPASGAYVGQVLTMLDGPAQGHSARVVGYVYNAASGQAVMQISALDGLMPNPAAGNNLGDQFVINGRPFSGTGFGFNWYGQYNYGTTPPTVPTSNTALLNATDVSIAMPGGVPYALLPNHANFTPNPAINYYDPAGPAPSSAQNARLVGSANEPYDAVDFQNMLLALRYYDATPGIQKVVTVNPSLHRPELLAYFSYWATTNKPAAAAIALNFNNPTASGQTFRSKVILRPEPGYQQFQDLNGNGMFDYREPFIDMNGDGLWESGETWIDLNYDDAYTSGDTDFTGKPFNPITGPYCYNGASNLWSPDNTLPTGADWDVDNDSDGAADSIWVDLGFPVQTASDGTQFKYLAAILCEEMDSKINLNAHGTTAQLDINRYTGTVNGPYVSKTTATAATPPVVTETGTGTITPNGNAPLGQGYGTPEINPAYFYQWLSTGTNTVSTTGLTYFSYLTQGFVDTSGAYPVYYDGKYGEAGRIVGATYTYPGVYVPSSTVTLTAASTIGNPLYGSLFWGGPRPGWSRWIDPYYSSPSVRGYPFVNDQLALARFSDVRPLLLQPNAQWSNNPTTNSLYDWNAGGLVTVPSPYLGPGYYFDFVGSTLYPNGGTAAPGATLHLPTAYGSPHDLPGRGVVAVDMRGQPYYGGTTMLPWMGYTSDPTLTSMAGENDAVDSPYELDLSRDAQRTGRNTGDNYSGNGVGFAAIDAPFTPTELSGILRSNDLDSPSLRTRLDVFGNTAGLTNKLSENAARLKVTTESWDLPVPGVLPTSLQAADIMTFNNYYAASGATMPMNGLSVADLARARIFAENLGNAAYGGPPSTPDLALFGNPAGGVWPLLSPDLVMGLRLDVNRLLGNGQDDNANGVVDEPLEALLGEAMLYPANLLASTGAAEGAWAYLDHNNDGLYPAALVDPTTAMTLPVDATLADTRARQLLARHLYVLMMLMIDDRFVTANAYQTPGTSPLFPWNSIPLNGGGGGSSKEQAAYLVAQWAINAVDFRDRDSIMTPFEFDLHPFIDDDGNPANGTWDVDDIVGTRVTPSADDLNVAYRGLVWGCERPALLLTESLAFHDRGVDDTSTAQKLDGGQADTAVDNTALNINDPKYDHDYDQVRRPRGTIAVELFNTTSPSDAPARDLQYDSALGANQPWVASNATGQGINLLQVAYGAATAGNPSASPVWRLAVVYSSSGKVFYTGQTLPTGTLDPRVPVLPDAANATPGTLSNTGASYIYRTAYFAPWQLQFRDPSSGAIPYINGVLESQSFFGDPTIVGGYLMLPPNQYGLVASAANAAGVGMTYLGKNSPGAQVNQNPVEFRLGSAGTNFVTLTNNVGVPLPGTPYPALANLSAPGNIKAIIGVPIQTNWLNASFYYMPQGSGVPARTLRFSISEPPNGYPVLTSTAGPITADDAFFYQTPGSPVAGVTLPQHPWDSGNDATVGTSVNPYVAPSTSTPSGNANDSSMTIGYTFIYLQRLANPLAVWDPFANPYITVDRMPLDLAAYNGEYSGTGGSMTPSEPPINTTTVKGYGYNSVTAGAVAALESRRRGNNGTVTANTDAPNIWTPSNSLTTSIYPIDGSYASPFGPTGPIPTSSFGYLNYQSYEYGPYWSTLSVPQPPVGASGVPVTQYYGDPSSGPFPWLPWNDRPYVSQYELMQVPVSTPASLLSDFGMLGQHAVTNEYTPGQNATVGQLPFAAFQHLLNFDDSQSSAPLTNPLTSSTPGLSISHAYRLFEYIHVPSRFTGTQTMLAPGLFSGLNAGPTGAPQPHYFHPPFNWLPRYREPGRINVNTATYPYVFEGLMDGYPGYGALWTQLLGSRQGYGYGTATQIPNAMTMYYQASLATPTQGMYPTYYANPFRPDSEAAFTPPLYTKALPAVQTNMTHLWGSYSPSYILGAPPAVPPIAGAPSSTDYTINATMQRMAQTSLATNANATTITPTAPIVGLFDDTNFDSNNTTANFKYLNPAAGPPPAQATFSSTPFRDPGRNPYFQYQAYQRLGNLTTNRSNVYAIWITLGKFQVQPVAVSITNPDGYQIIAEMDDGNGDHQRERAFYLFDRSIPVGFVRGQNLNIENAVLLEQQLD